MIWRKIQNLNPAFLGAMNGLIFILLLEIIFRILYFWYLYEQHFDRFNPNKVNINSFFIVSFNLKYYFGLFLTLVSTILVTYLISRGLLALKKHTIIFWQVVGFFSVVVLIVLGRIQSLIEEYFECAKLNCSQVLLSISPGNYRQDLFQVVLFLIIILGFNFLFSLFLQERKTNFS